MSGKLIIMFVLITFNVAKFLSFFLFISELLRFIVKKIEEKIKAKKKIRFLHLLELSWLVAIIAILECLTIVYIFELRNLELIFFVVIILITTIMSIIGLGLMQSVIIYKLEDLIEENYPFIKSKYYIKATEEEINFFENGTRCYKAGFALDRLNKINNVIEFCEYETKWERYNLINQKIKSIKERWLGNAN